MTNYVGPVKVSVEVIGPSTAAEWLTANIRNRPMKQTTIKRYAQDIKAGAWDVNGESIKFSSSGVLLDGQNRLAACVLADASFASVVVRGLRDEDQETVDTGVRRSLADVLTLRGYKQATTLAAVVNGVWAFRRSPDMASRGTLYPTVHQALSLLEECPGMVESVAVGERVRVASGLKTGVSGPLHFITQSIDQSDADFFWARLIDGVGLTDGHPVLVLRSILMSERSLSRRSLSTWYLWAITVKAWNAYRRGDTIKLLVFRPGGAHPESFPVPA